MTLSRTALCLVALIIPLAACDLPKGAGQAGQILSGADDPGATFGIMPVTTESLPLIATWPIRDPSATQGWLGASRGPADPLIQAGDLLNVLVWDNEETSLLTSGGQKVTDLKGVKVSSGGTVFLPYINEVYVAKMTETQAREAIQSALTAISPTAQVQLSVAQGPGNSVNVVGGVRQPGVYPLLSRNQSVLDTIGAAGGVASGDNPQVRLSRGGVLYGISFDRLSKSPGLDATVRGGDKLFIVPEERFFLALGASGKEAPILFNTDQVTALDALSLSGGLVDSRANPKGILILREYAPGDVRGGTTGPDKGRMVFTIDLTSADGIFSAGKFQMQHRDVVMVTESPVTATQTVLGLITSVFGATRAVERTVN